MGKKHGTTAEDLLGKLVLVGLTKLDRAENVISQEQLHGVVTAVDSTIHLRLPDGTDYTLPPDPAAFSPAVPGEYRLPNTGYVVVNPDFTATWTIHYDAQTGCSNRREN